MNTDINDETDYIDVTPTWARILPHLIEGVRSKYGSISFKIAVEELTNMAMLADQRNDLAREPNAQPQDSADVPGAIEALNHLIDSISLRPPEDDMELADVVEALKLIRMLLK